MGELYYCRKKSVSNFRYLLFIFFVSKNFHVTESETFFNNLKYLFFFYVCFLLFKVTTEKIYSISFTPEQIQATSSSYEAELADALNQALGGSASDLIYGVTLNVNSNDENYSDIVYLVDFSLTKSLNGISGDTWVSYLAQQPGLSTLFSNFFIAAESIFFIFHEPSLK